MAIGFNLRLRRTANRMPAGSLRVVVDDWAVPADVRLAPLPPLPLPDTPGIRAWLEHLPDASGEFTGTFDKGTPDG